MAYIFLDVTKQSLRNDFDRFSYRLNNKSDYESFIRYCFPECSDGDYLLFSPSIELKYEETQGSTRRLKNIALYPQHNFLQHVLSNCYSIVAIGDINIFNSFYKFEITSIEIIDSNCIPSTSRAVRISGQALIAFNDAQWGARSDFANRRVDFEDTAINSVVIDELVAKKPVEDIASVNNLLSEWYKYIDFREKWSKIAVENCRQPLYDCKIIEAYTISDADYNQEKYEKLLLDGKPEFAPKSKGNRSNGDSIYLGKQVPSAEKVSVLKITLQKNKKEAEAEKWERKVNRLLRDQLQLEKAETSDQNKNKRKGVSIGDGKELLIKTIYTDIKPDCSSIETKYESKINESNKQIEEKYRDIIEQDVKDFLKKKLEEIKADFDEKLQKGIDDLEQQYAKKLELRNEPEAENEIKKKISELKEKKDKEPINELQIVQSVYNERKEKQKNVLRSLQDKEYQRQLKEEEETRRKDEERRLSEIKSAEIRSKEESLRNKMQQVIDEKVENETIRQAEIYIYLDETTSLKEEKLDVYKYLSYDDFMERIKIKRQKESLEALKYGKFKNPMLTSFLFEPKNLPEVSDMETDIEWENSKLNDVQKEAVTKALNASGIFMLQGPPGTGKTTVIAELTAQFVKRKMRVLIASETHKAIDNAFEEIDKLRLPQAHLMRLFSDGNKKSKDSQWQYQNLTGNFYSHIKERLSKSTEVYRNFKKRQEEFDKEFVEMLGNVREIIDLKTNTHKERYERVALDEERKELNLKIRDLKSEIDKCDDDISQWNESHNIVTRMSVDDYELPETEEHEAQIIAENFKNAVISVKNEYPINFANPCEIINADVNKVKADIARLAAPDRTITIEEELSRIRTRMGELEDDGQKNTAEYLELKEKRKKLVNEKNSLKNKGQVAPDLYIYKLVDKSSVLKQDLADMIQSAKEKLLSIQKDYKVQCEEGLKKVKDTKADFVEQKETMQKQFDEIDKKIKGIDSNKDVEHLKKLEKEVKKQIQRYFDEFGINDDYKNDFSKALQIIKEQWKIKKDDYERNKSTMSARVDIMRDISKYIENGAEVRDNAEMNPKLAQLVDVFGMTSSGNDRLNPDEIKGVNLKRDIDVVIIDEVSKSSFLDMVRPMLYGKKVILVGDHLQLPPMYDLKHLRKEDLEDIPEDVVTLSTNKKYTEIMEKCLFERLYNDAPPSYKIMLNRQYRFHSQIMEANPFYGDALKLGIKDLDSRKEHGMTIKDSNGRDIITPERHICFIDCGKSYESCPENSNSLINIGEAEVVRKLLEQIAQNRGTKNPLSVGVICTYGRQAKKIKDLMNRDKYLRKALNENCGDEKFVVSTVDDFQGDERDVIILSMVRNPRPNKRYSLDFIRTFQRINVAITRPRKLLIVVGALDFLRKKALVDFKTAKGKNCQGKSIFDQIYQQAMKCEGVAYMDNIIDFKTNK